MDKKQLISDYIESHKEEYLQDLAALIAVPSIRGEALDGAPYGEMPKKALETALALCERYGFRTENHENYVGTASIGGEPGLDILGHLDVVGVTDSWSTDPFIMHNKEGVLYGRGVSDDKGPTLAALYGLRAVVELGLPLRSGVRVIMGTDEECGSSDIHYFYNIKKMKSAPYTFTPDASFPVYNIEKGRYAPKFSKTWEPETCEPRVIRVFGDFTTNIVPAKASAQIVGLSDQEITDLLGIRAQRLNVGFEVRDGVVTIRGVSSHASQPEQGNNALTALLVLLSSLPLAECASTEAIVRLISLFPHGDCHGAALGVDMKDGISGRLSLAFSKIDLNSTGVTGEFDSRVPACATDENCRQVIERRFADAGFTAEGRMSKCHYTPADTPFVQGLLKSYEEFTGLKGECLSMGGGTYVHEIEGGVAFGAVMPGVDTNMHGDDENIKLDELLTAAKIFGYAISEICG